MENVGKLEIAQKICNNLKIDLKNVAYVGDDINCYELLSNVGYAACPSNAVNKIKSIPNIIKLNKKGGNGAVWEFIDKILIER